MTAEVNASGNMCAQVSNVKRIFVSYVTEFWWKRAFLWYVHTLKIIAYQ